MIAGCENKGDCGPAHAYQKTVGARHVGNGIMRIGAVGILACHPCKIHVNGIFRQNGNKGHDSNCNSLGHIKLGGLAGPGKHKGSAKNGNAA